MASTASTKRLTAHLKGQFQFHNLLPEQLVFVGYSGGRDSSVLLALTSLVWDKNRVVAFHVDHGLRPPEERHAERALVVEQCQRWGVVLKTFDAPASPGVTAGLEARARKIRYGAFGNLLEEYPGAILLLAHHAQDQAETILMRLLKGRSWQGLAGMPVSRPGYLRPFLSLPPKDLAVVAQDLELVWWTDSTNADLTLRRNLLRNKVLPLLEPTFPRAVLALTEFGATWSQLLPESPHPLWKTVGSRSEVPIGHWESWTPVRREAELLALLARAGNTSAVARRSLEPLVRENKSPWSASVGNFRFTRSSTSVVWEMVAKVKAPQYFIRVTGGQPADVGEFTVSWSLLSSNLSHRVEGIDVSKDVFWSTEGSMAAKCAGMSRFHRDHALYLLQDGAVKAAFNREGLLFWKETDEGRLNGQVFFVTLKRRSTYER
jgi:tRNA(Ile)-lysidine synthetase-like protein